MLLLFILLVGAGAFSSVASSTGVQLVILFTSDFQWCCLTYQGSPVTMQHVVSVESSSLIFHNLFSRFIHFTAMIQ